MRVGRAVAEGGGVDGMVTAVVSTQACALRPLRHGKHWRRWMGVFSPYCVVNRALDERGEPCRTGASRAYWR